MPSADSSFLTAASMLSASATATGSTKVASATQACHTHAGLSTGHAATAHSRMRVAAPAYPQPCLEGPDCAARVSEEMQRKLMQAKSVDCDLHM